jgi:hypothetical protein
MEEIEVFRKTPKIGRKCYEHVEATRKEYVGHGNYKYYSTNKPTYVGKLLSVRNDGGGGDGATTFRTFEHGDEVEQTEMTCFKKVKCNKSASHSGGYSRRLRRHTKKHRKTRFRK